MGTCQLCLSNAHFVFSFLFFLFCPEKVKVLPAHCPFQCPLILAYYYHTRCSSPPLGTVSRPRCPFKRETERDTFFHSRDNRIELSSVSVDIERIVPRGERESYPCNFPLSLWSTTPTPTPTQISLAHKQCTRSLLSHPRIVLALFNVSKYSLSSFLCVFVMQSDLLSLFRLWRGSCQSTEETTEETSLKKGFVCLMSLRSDLRSRKVSRCSGQRSAILLKNSQRTSAWVDYTTL